VHLASCIDEIKEREKIRQKAQEILNQKDSLANKCTYELRAPLEIKATEGLEQDEGDEGYIFQELFSCRTCYEDQIEQMLTDVAKGNTQMYEERFPKAEEWQVIKETAEKFKVLEEEERLNFLEDVKNIEIRDVYKI